MSDDVRWGGEPSTRRPLDRITPSPSILSFHDNHRQQITMCARLGMSLAEVAAFSHNTTVNRVNTSLPPLQCISTRKSAT